MVINLFIFVSRNGMVLPDYTGNVWQFVQINLLQLLHYKLIVHS